MKKAPTPPETAPTGAAPAPVARMTPGLRTYFYLTSAICGAAILIVEILGAKMLTPFFGSSHFVWTAQIAVTLVSLAIGYFLGGLLVDRSPNLGRMYAAILAAAIYLCVSIPLTAPVSFACLKMKLAVGSLFAAVFLFFVPLTLLAMVGPFLIRHFTQSLSTVGSSVGRLNAISTFGSVGGTLLISYLLIPRLPNSITMYLTAIVLMALSIAYFFLLQKKALGGAATVVVFINLFIGLGSGYAGIRAEVERTLPGFEVLERRNSNFGQMLVIQHTNEPMRYYLNDFLTQNTYDILQKKSTSMFTYMLYGLSRAYTPKTERALCIGLGIGIVPMDLAKDGVKVDVVEINPDVAGLAERHFNFDPTKVNVLIDDGRHYLNECAKKSEPLYDTIILDAFLGDSSPAHLMSREAFTAMRDILRPGGTLIINSFGDLETSRNFFTASLERTLQTVFKSVRIHTAWGGNILLVASQTPDLQFAREPDFSQVHSAALGATRRAFENIVSTPPHTGRVLTDDFNPVEYFDAANRESVRRNLLTFWN